MNNFGLVFKFFFHKVRECSDSAWKVFQIPRCWVGAGAGRPLLPGPLPLEEWARDGLRHTCCLLASRTLRHCSLEKKTNTLPPFLLVEQWMCFHCLAFTVGAALRGLRLRSCRAVISMVAPPAAVWLTLFKGEDVCGSSPRWSARPLLFLLPLQSACLSHGCQLLTPARWARWMGPRIPFPEVGSPPQESLPPPPPPASVNVTPLSYFMEELLPG